LIPLGGNSDIDVGSQVYMKKAPIYHSGSIGFTVAGKSLFVMSELFLLLLLLCPRVFFSSESF
jgi:hypothetical protein